MSFIDDYKSYKIYTDTYTDWREENSLREAKRQEFLRKNPTAIKDYDIQRSKVLLRAVDVMYKESDSSEINTLLSSTLDLGLEYATVGGTALGFLCTKLKFVKNFIDKLVKHNPKAKNIIPTAITALSGVAGIMAAIPIYDYISGSKDEIDRKNQFVALEKELSDPRIFVVLDSEQEKQFKHNVENLEEPQKRIQPIKTLKKSYKAVKGIPHEILKRKNEIKNYEDKYFIPEELFNKELTNDEIKNAKKDQYLLTNLVRKINTKAQSYQEKISGATNTLITMSFALGSLLTLGYERLAKHFKWKASAIPAGLGIYSMLATTFLAAKAEKRAVEVGKFKTKQELMEHPEQLVYISDKKTGEIKDVEISEEIVPKKTSKLKFLKEFWQANKEYEKWKKDKSLSGKELSKALENINFSDEQIKDGKRLQNNMFRTFYTIDKNAERYSTDITAVGQTLQYLITLALGSTGSVLGMKYLAKLRTAKAPKEIVEQTLKYIGTTLLFAMPSLVINDAILKERKRSARISDMLTIQELSDYKIYADYSRFSNRKE